MRTILEPYPIACLLRRDSPGQEQTFGPFQAMFQNPPLRREGADFGKIALEGGQTAPRIGGELFETELFGEILLHEIQNVLADILYKANEVFKRAIDAIIHFGTEQHKSIFAPSEAADIKSVMQEYGETTEQQNAVGAWLCDYAESRQPFGEIKHCHTLKEVGDVAEGKYDWKINSKLYKLTRG